METTIRSQKSAVRPFVFGLIVIAVVIGAVLVGMVYANQTTARTDAVSGASAYHEQRQGEWTVGNAAVNAGSAYYEQRQGEWSAGIVQGSANCASLPTQFEQARCMGVR
jgi:hypothetical protein